MINLKRCFEHGFAHDCVLITNKFVLKDDHIIYYLVSCPNVPEIVFFCSYKNRKIKDYTFLTIYDLKWYLI